MIERCTGDVPSVPLIRATSVPSNCAMSSRKPDASVSRFFFSARSFFWFVSEDVLLDASPAPSSARPDLRPCRAKGALPCRWCVRKHAEDARGRWGLATRKPSAQGGPDTSTSTTHRAPVSLAVEARPLRAFSSISAPFHRELCPVRPTELDPPKMSAAPTVDWRSSNCSKCAGVGVSGLSALSPGCSSAHSILATHPCAVPERCKRIPRPLRCSCNPKLTKPGSDRQLLSRAAVFSPQSVLTSAQRRILAEYLNGCGAAVMCMQKLNVITDEFETIVRTAGHGWEAVCSHDHSLEQITGGNLAGLAVFSRYPITQVLV